MVDGVINESDTTPKQKPKQRQSSPQQQQQSTPSSGGRTTRRRNHIVYEFDFPSELCGRLIGRNGKNINILKDRSGIEITIKRKPYTKELQVVCLEGTQKQIDAALEQIKKRFPPSQFQQINFAAINSAGVECPVLPPEVMQLSLPEGVTVDIIVSSVVAPNHVFVQQPTHAMYPLLDRQNQCMLLCYNQDGIVPQLPRPLEVGVICAAPMYGGWYRSQIVQTYPDTDECDIKFVDFGGYMSVHGSILRQIRSDFTTLPFQAVECYLANLAPPKDMETFQPEAAAVLEELVHGQPLQLEVIAHEEDGVPYINLFLLSRDQIIFVNRELVNRGVARWLET
ncbi:A-kinase anchor protein 1, mitochondrial [Lamellibrachia satsuma]|nr:A-kinase anchor protein 1, mitochondrial [Lamellibrachia satsuma]